MFEDSVLQSQIEQSSNKAIPSCPCRPKSPPPRPFPSSCQKRSSANLSCPTSLCPNVGLSANSAITVSSTSSYGCSTPACNGSVYLYLKHLMAPMPSITPPSTRSSPAGATTVH